MFLPLPKFYNSLKEFKYNRLKQKNNDMKKTTLFLFSLFLSIGAMAQFSNENLLNIESGDYYIYHTDANGVKHYLQIAGENQVTTVTENPKYFTVTKNVTGNYITATSGKYSTWYKLEMNGLLISNTPQDGSLIETKTWNGNQDMNWAVQAIFCNQEGKVAIRLTNATSENNWHGHWFIGLDANCNPVAVEPSNAEFLWTVIPAKVTELSTGKFYSLRASSNNNICLEIADYAKETDGGQGSEGALQYKTYVKGNEAQLFYLEEVDKNANQYYLKNVKDDVEYYLYANQWNYFAQTENRTVLTITKQDDGAFTIYQSSATHNGSPMVGYLGNDNSKTNGSNVYSNNNEGNHWYFYFEGDMDEPESPEVPEVPAEFSYETLDKPAFANGGNTTQVAMIEFNGENKTGFTYTQGETTRFDMPQVEAGKTYSLDLTYNMAWGDLAIFQIDKNNNEKKYGYYTCLWNTDASPLATLQNSSSELMCDELGIESFDKLEAISAGDQTYLTVPYEITIDENLEAGDIVVVRVMVGKDSPAYNAQDIAEGGCLDLVFAVKEPEVVLVELAAGKYFRLKGNGGQYLTNDGANTGNTTLQTKENADINSIFYVEEGQDVDCYYIISYENGYYVANPYRNGVGEEIVPSTTNEYFKQQWEITGSNGVYTFRYGIENGSGHYMTNVATGGTGWRDEVNESAYWTLEEVTELPVTISAAGWATFYAPVEVKKPEGVKAYYLPSGGVKNGYVTMEEITIDIIPANSAVVLQGDAKEHSFEITNNDYTAIIDNLFHGTVAATYITEESYVLANGSIGIGLYEATLNKKNGTAFLNNSHKAYLPASEVPAGAALSAGFRFAFGGTTAIEEVCRGEVGSPEIYDLTGRRLSEITKPGIYIINGKKILVK